MTEQNVPVDPGSDRQQTGQYRKTFITSCVFSALTVRSCRSLLLMVLTGVSLFAGWIPGFESMRGIVLGVWAMFLVAAAAAVAAVSAVLGVGFSLVSLCRRPPRTVRTVCLVFAILCVVCFAVLLLLFVPLLSAARI